MHVKRKEQYNIFFVKEKGMKCERCTFSTDFSTPTFLERKVGKRALCETSFRFWGSALRGGRGRSVLSSDGKNQRSPGDGSDERLRAAGAHSHLSPKPPIYGSVSLWVYVCSRRAKSRSVSVLLLAHWGLLPSKFEGIATLTYAASCVPTCLVRRWLVRSPATAQLPQLFCTRRCHFNGFLSKFKYVGPSGPRQVVSQILSSGRRKVSIKSPGGRPP